MLAVVLATQSMQTACPKDSPLVRRLHDPQTGEVFTTRDGVRFRVETVLSGLEIPWSMNFAPDGRLFVTERPGRVRIVTLGGSSELALSLDDVYTQGEAGLLGLALDPDFAQNRFVYIYYSAPVSGGAVNRIVRYREVNSRLGERVVLLDNIPAAQIHDGGRLRFGPDGLLYATRRRCRQREPRTGRCVAGRQDSSAQSRRHRCRATIASVRPCTPTVIAIRKGSTGIQRAATSGPSSTGTAAMTR